MKKIICVLVSIMILMSFAISSNAAVLDKATVNTTTNTVRVKGNVKKISETIIHDVGIKDSSFDEGLGEITIYSPNAGGDLLPILEQFEESDGNKCLRLSNRTQFTCGFQFNVADYFNKYGLGKYTFSFRMKNGGGTNLSIPAVLMTKKNGQQMKYTSTVSAGAEWKTITINYDVSCFGYDSEGNPLQICPTGPYSRSGNDGVLYMITTSADKAHPDLYLDDFVLKYNEKKTGYTGDELLDCDLTVMNGCDQVDKTSFKCEANGDYDFCMPIAEQNDYSNISATVTCNDAGTKATLNADIKTNEPGFSLAYENSKYRVGIYPYDYIKALDKDKITFLSALYSADGKLVDAGVCQKFFDGSNQMIAMELDDANQSGDVVKVFTLDNLMNIKPVGEKSVKNTQKEPHHVYLIGDSICYTYPLTTSYWPKQGWGYVLPDYFDDCLTFHNCSGGGLSTKSYISPIYSNDETKRNTWKSEADPLGDWSKIKATLKPGDFVIMGLGVNDTGANPESPYSKGTTESVYADNIKIFANGAKEKGANIVFTTMTLHGGSSGQLSFENDNTANYQKRAKVMMRAADEVGAVYVDLGAFQLDYYYKMAELGGNDKDAFDKIRSFYHMPSDNLHYSINGANLLAKMVAYLIRNSESEMAKYVKDFELKYEFEDVSEQYNPFK